MRCKRFRFGFFIPSPCIAVIPLLFLLQACDNTPSQKEILDLINANSEQLFERCINFNNSNSYTKKDQKGDDWLYIDQEENKTFLDVAKRLSLISATEPENQRLTKGWFGDQTVDVPFVGCALTDSGVKIYNKECADGFLIGKQMAVKVESFTPPAVDSRGIKVIHVTYDVGVKYLNGMTEELFKSAFDPPENDIREATLRYENNGWAFEKDD